MRRVSQQNSDDIEPLMALTVAATKAADGGKLGFETPDGIPAEKVGAGTNLRHSPRARQDKPALGFKMNFITTDP